MEVFHGSPMLQEEQQEVSQVFYLVLEFFDRYLSP